MRLLRGIYTFLNIFIQGRPYFHSVMMKIFSPRKHQTYALDLEVYMCSTDELLLCEVEHVIHLPQGANLPTECKSKQLCSCCYWTGVTCIVLLHFLEVLCFRWGVCIFMCQGRAGRTIGVLFPSGVCSVDLAWWLLFIFLKHWLSGREEETIVVGWPSHSRQTGV